MPNSSIEKVKIWLFPTLVTVIGMFIWQEIKEIKSDVKALLAQSNIDKTRIDNIERQIFNKSTGLIDKTQKDKQKIPPTFHITEFLPVKEEELYEIHKS